jgi:hypothetical protein
MASHDKVAKEFNSSGINGEWGKPSQGYAIMLHHADVKVKLRKPNY